MHRVRKKEVLVFFVYIRKLCSYFRNFWCAPS